MCRARKFVSHMRGSSVAAEEMRVLQRQQIRRQNEGLEDIEEEPREETESDEPGYDAKEHGGKLTKVLAWRAPVETRWNSLYYMVERLLAMRPACEEWCRDHAMQDTLLEVRESVFVIPFLLTCSFDEVKWTCVKESDDHSDDRTLDLGKTFDDSFPTSL